MDPPSVILPCDLSGFSEIIDARSPSEFADDHLPGAVNLPVLGDAERQEIGILHKESPFRARLLGVRRILPAIERHLAGHFKDKPKGYLPLIYCWRGGERSRSLASILCSVGWRAHLLEGGYKSWRTHVIADLPRLLAGVSFRVLAGLTGTGKTRLLHALRAEGAQTLDLEDLAKHRGSLLGGHGSQPSQKHFETRLWNTLRDFDPIRPVFTEAESSRVGSIQLPAPFWEKLGRSGVVEVTLPLPERIRLLSGDYAHFIQRPSVLRPLLDGLRRIRGNAQVDEWQGLLDARDWPAFLQSILIRHYDSAYRPPGHRKSNYREPSRSLALEGITSADIRNAARKLLRMP